MKYLKLFENFEQNDFVLIFTNIKDNDAINVYMSGDLGDYNVTFINIEPLKNNICPYCDSGQIIESFYDENGERYKDEVDCPICSGNGELKYFEWDVIKDTIYNFYNYVGEDYYVECTTVGKGDTNFTHSDITTNYSLPLSEFLPEIDTNWKMQKIIDFTIIINSEDDNSTNEGFLQKLKDYCIFVVLLKHLKDKQW